MTFIVDGTNGLTFPNSTTQASAGQVLQVVSGTTTTEKGNSTNVYSDTTLTATITPKFSTSKILVLVSQNGIEKETTVTSTDIILVRNSTTIGTILTSGDTNSTSVNVVSNSFCYLDSPATTSATTYKTQARSHSNSGWTYTQVNGSISMITLLEIAQ